MEKEILMTREEAVETLYELLESGILNDALEQEVQEIANCIEEENNGLHIWGADLDEIITIHTPKRADLITPEHIKECQKICEKYAFGLSPFEKEQESESINEKYEGSDSKE